MATEEAPAAGFIAISRLRREFGIYAKSHLPSVHRRAFSWARYLALATDFALTRTRNRAAHERGFMVASLPVELKLRAAISPVNKPVAAGPPYLSAKRRPVMATSPYSDHFPLRSLNLALAATDFLPPRARARAGNVKPQFHRGFIMSPN